MLMRRECVGCVGCVGCVRACVRAGAEVASVRFSGYPQEVGNEEFLSLMSSHQVPGAACVAVCVHVPCASLCHVHVAMSMSMCVHACVAVCQREAREAKRVKRVAAAEEVRAARRDRGRADA